MVLQSIVYGQQKRGLPVREWFGARYRDSVGHNQTSAFGPAGNRDASQDCPVVPYLSKSEFFFLRNNVRSVVRPD